MLALIVEALREAGLRSFQLRFGDLGLFTALLDALPMPERWRRRLRHQFWRPEAFRAELGAPHLARTPCERTASPRELIDRLDPAQPPAALAIVEAYLERAGLELIGTRTLPEIAERLLAAPPTRAKRRCRRRPPR